MMLSPRQLQQAQLDRAHAVAIARWANIVEQRSPGWLRSCSAQYAHEVALVEDAQRPYDTALEAMHAAAVRGA